MSESRLISELHKDVQELKKTIEEVKISTSNMDRHIMLIEKMFRTFLPFVKLDTPVDRMHNLV